MGRLGNNGQRSRRIAGRGAALVELALVLPLLLIIIFGAIDFGRFAHAYITVTNAARAGADFGSVSPFTGGTQAIWETAVRQRVLLEMQSIIDADNFGPADLKVIAKRNRDNPADAASLWRVQVEVTYPFEVMVPWPWIPNRIDMYRCVEMRGIR